MNVDASRDAPTAFVAGKSVQVSAVASKAGLDQTVVHGRDAVEHMVACVVDIVEDLLFKRQHARFVEIARAGEEILAIGVFAAERPGDEVATVVEALTRNKVVALLVPSGGVDTRDIPALALTERFGAHAGKRFAGAAQTVELGEFLKAALFGGTIVFIECE